MTHIKRDSTPMKAFIASLMVLSTIILFAHNRTAYSESISGDSEVIYLPFLQTGVPFQSVPANAAPCKLPETQPGGVGLGIPRFPERMNSLGTVRAKVIFVDFSDVPAQLTPEEVFAYYSPDAEDYYTAVSYGQMTYQLEPQFEWYRMSQPSTSADYGWGAYVSHHNFIQEAMDLADADVNFAGVHQVLIITPPSATAFTFSAALVPNPGDGAEADGVTIDNAVTLHNTGFFGGRLLNHESGHSLGLIDLYAYEGQDRHRFVGGFDAMGLIAGFAPEYMAYHRWMLAWLADSQIFCQQTNEETVYLTPIEKPGGVKAVMVPVGPTTLVVVESRRAIGYDNALPKEGVLVYVVDSSISTGQGGIQVHPQLNDPLYYDSPLAQGEQVTVQGMTIEVIEASAGADLVRVTNNN